MTRVLNMRLLFHFAPSTAISTFLDLSLLWFKLFKNTQEVMFKSPSQELISHYYSITVQRIYMKTYIGWKVSKYRDFSGQYFPVFGLSTEIYSVVLRIQCEYRKIWTRKNSVFGHFNTVQKWFTKLHSKKTRKQIAWN